MDNIIIFPKAKFWCDVNGILHCKFNNRDAHHKLKPKRVLEYANAIITLSEGQARPLLVDLRQVVGTFELDAAKLISNHPEFTKLIVCEAYVLDSMAMRLLVLTYKRIFNPSTPYKIFYSTHEALHYCEESKKNYHEIR